MWIIIIINIDISNSNNIYFIIIIIINEITVETSCYFRAELVSLVAMFCLVTQHSSGFTVKLRVPLENTGTVKALLATSLVGDQL